MNLSWVAALAATAFAFPAGAERKPEARDERPAAAREERPVANRDGQFAIGRCVDLEVDVPQATDDRSEKDRLEKDDGRGDKRDERAEREDDRALRRDVFSARRHPELEFELALRPPQLPVRALQLELFTPRGFLYQTLTVSVPPPGSLRAKKRLTARLAVGGSWIKAHALYGKWRVVPHLDGDPRPCGPERRFEIRE